MNKTFKRIRNAALAFLLSVGMVLGMVPSYPVFAEDIVSQAAPALSIANTYDNVTGYTFEDTENGTLVTYKTGEWYKLTHAVENSDVTKYNKLLVDITFNEPTIFGVYYNNGTSDVKLRSHNSTDPCDAGRQTFEFELTEDVTAIHFYIDPPVDKLSEKGVEKTLVIHSVKIVSEAGEEPTPEPEPEPVVPAVAPSIAIDTASPGYTFTDAGDGSLKVSFERTGAACYERIKANISNCDITKYDALRIDIKPYIGMQMAVLDGNEQNWYRRYTPAFDSANRQIVEIKLDQNAEGVPVTDNIDALKFFLDANEGNTPGTKEFTIYKIWLCNSQEPIVQPVEPSEPEVKLTDKAVFTGLASWDTGYTKLETSEGSFATIQVSANADCRLRMQFDKDSYTFTPGDVFVMQYEGTEADTLKGIKEAYIGFNDGSGENIILTNPGAKNDLVYFTIPEDKNGFFAEKKPDRIRFKGILSTKDTVINIKSLHIYDGAEFAEYLKSLEEPVVIEEPTEPRYAKVNFDTTSKSYTLEKQADGSVKVSYVREGKDNWDTVKIDIVNDDFDKYDQLRIELTPADGMQMAILTTQDKEVWYRHHNEFDNSDKQVIKINLKKDDSGKAVDLTTLTGIRLFCDAQNKLSGERSFVIHKMWLANAADPDFIPAEKAKFTTIRTDGGATVSSQEEGGFATLTGATNSTTRLYMNFENYTYNAGDVFLMKYDGTDFDTLKSVEAIIGFDNGTPGHYSFSDAKQAGDYIYFTLPEDKDSKFASKQPKYIRFKGVLSETGETVNIKGLHIYDGEEFKKFISSFSYNEEDCPQGVAISFYSDIYSRGFAWATNDQIDSQYIEYIKASNGLSKETVDWASKDVVKKEAKRGTDRVDVSNVTWHMFKVHLENLEKGATYFFRVGNEKFGFSDIGSFKIEGEKEDIDKLTFVHLTDCQEGNQSGYTRWAKVLEAAYNTAPDSKFVAFTGDLTNDSHANLTMVQWNWGLNEPKKTLLNSIIMPSAGNHDEYPYSFTDRFDINWADYIKVGDKDPRTNKPVTDGTLDERTGGCYSFMYGEDVAFINLNTNDTNNEADFTTQYEWLKGELEKYKDVKWKIVQVHKGLMSTGNHTNDGEVDWLRDILPPLFAEYKVDLVLQGHDHVYTRSRSYYYGNDFDDKLYDGHTPCWLNGIIMDDFEFQGKVRPLTNWEPNGTHYVTINYCANKSYAVEKNLDKVIYPANNPIEGNECSIQLTNSPMYGVVQIDGDTLIYDSYVYKPDSKESVLYDTFMVQKGTDLTGDWNRGYRDRYEGKEIISLEGIDIEDKEYDGKPVTLDLSGFVSNMPILIDYSLLKFDITGDNGFASDEKLPTERGHYTVKVTVDNVVEIGREAILYCGDEEFEFSIR